MEVPGAGVVVFSVGARETWERLLDSDELPSGCSISGEKQGGFVEEKEGTEGASRASDRLTRTFFPTLRNSYNTVSSSTTKTERTIPVDKKTQGKKIKAIPFYFVHICLADY